MDINQQYQHRRSSKIIKLTRSDGSPVAGRKITIAQTRHKFLFGCGAFETLPFVNNLLQGEEQKAMQERLDKWLAIFNAGTLPFYWGTFEEKQGQPQTASLRNAARWLNEHGITVKGHTLCWHSVTAPWLLNMSNEEILKTQLDRIHRDVTDFTGSIDMWDVINEVVIMPVFDKYDNGITRICKELGRIKLVREIFAATKEANPQAKLLMNDFNTSISYEILIEGCLEAGIPIDIIGIQSHQHQGYWGVEKTEKILERFSRFGLPIHFTENTLLSGKLMPPQYDDLNDYQVKEWPSTPEGEERQAREITQFYKTLFAHPLVEAITTWDFVDGNWLGAPSGLLRKDNSNKPSYDELLNLVKKDWWTTKNLILDDNGEMAFTGFKGDYELICEDQKVKFTLDDSGHKEVIQI